MSHSGILIVSVGMCSVQGFAKQNFEIILERVELSYDPEIIKVDYKLTKYNRTCKALSCNFTLLKDVEYKDNVKVQVQVFALYSNEYRPVPVLFTRNLCDFFNMEFLWIKKIIEKNSDNNFPTKCPILAGDYNVKDFVPNGADFPVAANFPWKYNMFRWRFFYNDVVFISFDEYMTFDHDVELKRLG